MRRWPPYPATPTRWAARAPDLTAQAGVASTLFAFGDNTTIGAAEVAATGSVAMQLGTAAVFATHVRFTPLSSAGAWGLRVEVYTPCAYAAYFGWQAGRGYSGGALTSGADWTLATNTLGALTSPTVSAVAEAQGLLVAGAVSSGIMWIGPVLDLSDYFWYAPVAIASDARCRVTASVGIIGRNSSNTQVILRRNGTIIAQRGIGAPAGTPASLSVHAAIPAAAVLMHCSPRR